MRWVLNKHVVLIALTAFVFHALPLNTGAVTSFETGKKTADEAATLDTGDSTETSNVVPLRYAVAMGQTYAQPDTTDFEFPEEEERHLVRDISIFLIASVFVGYFIIKVFLEGDTEEDQPEEGNGKPTPL